MSSVSERCCRKTRERGAIVDIFAAAHLGMFDRVRSLVSADPSLVRARGGDGKTALHWAVSVDIAQYLLDHGAELEARDVDHESTAAQYLVRDAPDVTRFLIGRGATVDIFMAVGLRDAALVERCLRDDPALDHRTWHGKYSVAHHGRLLIEAGEHVDPGLVPTGRGDLDDVLGLGSRRG